MPALKASRYAGPSIERFFESGVLDLGAKLGPVLWQLAPGERFDAGDCDRFLSLLTRRENLRHALEASHPSFACAQFVQLARRRGVAYVDAGAGLADVTTDFIYARFTRSDAAIPTGYAPDEIDDVARRHHLGGWRTSRRPRLHRTNPAHATKRRVHVRHRWSEGRRASRRAGADRAAPAGLNKEATPLRYPVVGGCRK